jgi:hypothetical protein
VSSKLNEQGFDVLMSSPDEFKSFLSAGNTKWAQLIRTAKISLQ